MILVSISLCSTATMLLLNSSYYYISTGVATTLHFLYPLFVLLLCKFLYRDVIDQRTKKAMGLILIGILCFFIQVKIDSMIGLLLALLSGITYAVYLVEMEKKHLSRLHPLVFSFYISIDTCFLLLLVQLFMPSIVIPRQVGVIVVMCGFSLTSLIALVCLQFGSKHIGAKLVSLFSLFEPMTSLVAGFLILHEEVTIWKVVGCILIFIAVICLATKKSNTT